MPLLRQGSWKTPNERLVCLHTNRPDNGGLHVACPRIDGLAMTGLCVFCQEPITVTFRDWWSRFLPPHRRMPLAHADCLTKHWREVYW